MRFVTHAAWRLGLESIAPAPPKILDYLLHRWIVGTTLLENLLAPKWRHDARSALKRVVGALKS
ncbi:MAG: hypothetical protein CME06_15625 [Gemmatimonadetes bacterium]|nr:hypothetical protein [Gemmatimonadota bacterium]